jgi:hypothetical protein
LLLTATLDVPVAIFGIGSACDAGMLPSFCGGACPVTVIFGIAVSFLSDVNFAESRIVQGW